MANPALIDELEKQFRDNPRRVFARLANEYRKAGDFMRAIEICHAHVPQQPGYISGHIVLGQALYDAGELDQAQQTFQSALSLDPENLIALRQLGDIARNRQDYREARSWYTRLLEVDPQNDEIVAQLGEIALAEGDSGVNGSEAAARATQAEEQLSGVGTATAVAEAEEEDERAPEPVAVDEPEAEEDARDVHSHNDVSARLDAPAFEHDAIEATPVSEFTSIREPEPEPVSESDSETAAEFSVGDDTFLDERAFSSEESQPAAPDATAGAMPDATSGPAPDGEHDEDDVSWIAAESETVETVDFVVSDASDADATDFVVSEAAQDDDAESLAPQTDDFDFAFETEDYEDQPLRPHTGEALSIIAEEDPLAGVQPTRVFDRSPFGDPIDATSQAERDAEEASFEPLPVQDLEAAAAELPPVEELGGEGLVDEMTRWSADTQEPDAAPASETPDEPADAAHADIFVDSEAETIVEETEIAESIIDEPLDRSTQAEEPLDRNTPAQDPIDALDWSLPAAPSVPDESPVSESPHAETDDYGEMLDEPSPAEPRYPTPEAPADAAFAAPVSGEAAGEEPRAESPEQPAASPDEPHDEVPAGAFVTETMAELYLRQGFRNEALDVYRKLSAQAPDDQALRDRIAELEQQASAPAPDASDSASPLARNARSFFKSLASVEPPPPPPPAEPVPEFAAWDVMLSEAGDVDEQDDTAARALSNGYHAPAQAEPPRGAATRAADRKMSLHDIFGSAEDAERSKTAGSLDAFFTPEGERANTPHDEEEGREDLEAFNAWLEGLKK